MKSKQEIKEVLLCLNLQKQNFQLWNIARKELIDTVDESYFTLAIELLDSEKDEEVSAAIKAFSFFSPRLNPTKALSHILPFLENPIHCAVAFETVSQITHLAFAPTFIKYLHFPLEEIRLEALKALGHIQYPKLLDIALYVLNDSSPRVRAHACYLLGTLRNPIAVNALIKRLEDKEISLDGTVAVVAIGALGAIGDLAAVEPLQDLMQGLDEDYALAALHALWLIRRRDSDVFSIEQLSNPHASVRKAIVTNMAYFHQPEQYVEKLIQISQSDSSYLVQAKAIETLDAIGSPEALEAVEHWNTNHKRKS